MRVVGGIERHVIAVWVKNPQRKENVRIARRRGDEQRRSRGPRDFQLLFQGLREEVDTATVSRKQNLEVVTCIRREASVLLEVVLCPLRSRDGPFLLVSVRKGTVNVSQPQMHRSAMPGVFPLEEVIQEVLLHRPAVVRVELREVFQPMDFQVLLCLLDGGR